MSVNWSVPMPPLTSDDPIHPFNQPYAVGKTITGTLAPFVAAFRHIHVHAWLRETELETVIQMWQALHSEEAQHP